MAKLVDWRRAKGWTQQQLADELGCVIATVARYENGSRRPEDDLLRKVYILTERSVQPNDFHNISAWEAELIRSEGEAELARQAA